MNLQPVTDNLIAPTSEPERTLNITFVSETFYPEVNGVTNTLNYLVNGLQQRGHRLHIIRPRQQPGEKDQQINGIPHTTVMGMPIPGYGELKFGLPCKRKLLSLWKSSKPDIIYIATEGPLGLSALKAAKALGIPVFSGFHTNFQKYSSYYGVGWIARFLIAYGRYFHNQCNGTFVPTTEIKNLLTEWHIRDVSVLGRGVDCHKFSPAHRSAALREQWGLKSGDVAVIYVGRLAAEKNVGLAIRAYLRVKSVKPNSRFILVGDGPQKAKLQQQYPDFIFTGLKQGQELSKHFASGDIFLFPSKTDTFGNVVTEAMASGLGVVAFNEAAAAQHIEHLVSGIAVNNHNEDFFIKSTTKLACQPILLRMIREKARLTAQDIDWQIIIETFEQTLIRECNYDNVAKKLVNKPEIKKRMVQPMVSKSR